jgi:hypothetical protein
VKPLENSARNSLNCYELNELPFIVNDKVYFWQDKIVVDIRMLHMLLPFLIALNIFADSKRPGRSPSTMRVAEPI